MTIPKVIFKCSWIYNEIWKEIMKNKEKNKYYPSRRKISDYIKKVEKLWRKDERKVSAELSKIIGLKWKEEKIICYVVGRSRPFSDPLTMPIYKRTPDYFLDILIHELIHNLFVQNFEESKKAWNYFKRKYKKEKWSTVIHIIVHAIHSHIFLKFYDEKRLKREIKIVSSFPNPVYKKSWQIVQKEGYQNIIREFRKRI